MEQVDQKGGPVTIHGDFQDMAGQSPDHPGLTSRDPALSRRIVKQCSGRCLYTIHIC